MENDELECNSKDDLEEFRHFRNELRCKQTYGGVSSKCSAGSCLPLQTHNQKRLQICRLSVSSRKGHQGAHLCY